MVKRLPTSARRWRIPVYQQPTLHSALKIQSAVVVVAGTVSITARKYVQLEQQRLLDLNQVGHLLLLHHHPTDLLLLLAALVSSTLLLERTNARQVATIAQAACAVATWEEPTLATSALEDQQETKARRVTATAAGLEQQQRRVRVSRVLRDRSPPKKNCNHLLILVLFTTWEVYSLVHCRYCN
jgi:hypothetical protein